MNQGSMSSFMVCEAFSLPLECWGRGSEATLWLQSVWPFPIGFAMASPEQKTPPAQ
jgi:hypothetical protein